MVNISNKCKRNWGTGRLWNLQEKLEVLQDKARVYTWGPNAWHIHSSASQTERMQTYSDAKLAGIPNPIYLNRQE